MSVRSVRARGWCRADLAGGTLDIWPLGILHPGARTVNVALDLAVEVEISPIESGYRVRQGDSLIETRSLEELAKTKDGALLGQIAQSLSLPPFEARIKSDSPRGGGLGASSALAVAAIAAGLVFFTGDIAFRGSQHEYVRASALLGRILRRIEDLNSKLLRKGSNP